jgi:hypothetical protein
MIADCGCDVVVFRCERIGVALLLTRYMAKSLVLRTPWRTRFQSSTVTVVSM